MKSTIYICIHQNVSDIYHCLTISFPLRNNPEPDTIEKGLQEGEAQKTDTLG